MKSTYSIRAGVAGDLALAAAVTAQVRAPKGTGGQAMVRVALMLVRLELNWLSNNAWKPVIRAQTRLTRRCT